MNEQFDVTIDNCHKEPIHIPGSIQPHGYLLVVHPETFRVHYVSENMAELTAIPLTELVSIPLDKLLDNDFVELLKKLEFEHGFSEINPQRVSLLTQQSSAQKFNAVMSINERFLIIELEPKINEDAVSFNPVKNLINLSLNNLMVTHDIESVFEHAVDQIRDITGFDRVMLYKFDQDYNGEVVAESKVDSLNSFLKQHFPESDIPKQARELYIKNPIRLLADVDAIQSPLYPQDQPVDLGQVVLRSVSPIHCQYLRNMGVKSSMSISLIVSGKLWGLIACHHYSPHVVNFETREVALYFGLMLSYIISLKVQADAEHRDSVVRSLNASITEKMAEHIFFTDGLREESKNLKRMMNSTGVAWRLEDKTECFGVTPPTERIEALYEWATSNKLINDTIYYTNTLSKDYPEFADISDIASGVFILSVSSVSNLFIIWFRKEVEQTKDWGGKPEKMIEFLDDGSHRLMPRSSFRLWRENVKNQALAWEPIELSCALKFRNTVVNYVLSKSERLEQINETLEQKVAARTEQLRIEIANKERAQLELVEALSKSEESNRELERFAFVASHDLQEPLRKIQSFGGRIEYSESTLSDKGKVYLEKMMTSAQRMQTLIKGILSFSRIHRANDGFINLSFDQLIQDVILDLEMLIAEKDVIINTAHIGEVYGDQNQLRRVVQNIIQNSIKFTSQGTQPKIDIDVTHKDEKFVTIAFKDNGVGFDGIHMQKIFGLFERLHGKSEYEGTGLGLAICKKILSRHGGKIWADSELGKGATFFITVPLIDPKIN
ncbi:ATP-binding protein [Aliiglaciecola lipolytica]|uniref:ATP-binding protein n=1 Tax=Aliiglaciecola lipolytica TaxID=477689 RepID=UPI001C0884B9|nr:ATP-binding protein [Aliiglaciecola lipolytica]MBU2877956.1 GAF domain-containing protein [Aliiglaciecola lipolytica]